MKKNNLKLDRDNSNFLHLFSDFFSRTFVKIYSSIDSLENGMLYYEKNKYKSSFKGNGFI